MRPWKNTRRRGCKKPTCPLSWTNKKYDWIFTVFQLFDVHFSSLHHRDTSASTSSKLIRTFLKRLKIRFRQKHLWPHFDRRQRAIQRAQPVRTAKSPIRFEHKENSHPSSVKCRSVLFRVAGSLDRESNRVPSHCQATRARN